MNWAVNIKKLQKAVKEGLISQETLNQLQTAGPASADLVDSLTKTYETGTKKAKKTLQDFNKSYTFSLPGVAEGMASALTDSSNDTILKMATEKVGSTMGADAATAFYNKTKADLLAGKTTLSEVMKEYGITMEDVAAEVRKLKIEADVTVNWNGEPPTKKWGGIIKRNMGGIIPGYVNGKQSGTFQPFPKGFIRGPGTPRSDSILARVSKDEFVVNAMSTQRNRDVLEYINKGGVVHAGGGGIYNLSFVVNASDGMDEVQVARIVMRQLDRTLGLGAAK